MEKNPSKNLREEKLWGEKTNIEISQGLTEDWVFLAGPGVHLHGVPVLHGVNGDGEPVYVG